MNIISLLIFMLVLSSCTLLPTEEDRVINYSVAQRQREDELKRQSDAFLGKTQEEVHKACGEPKTREKNVKYQDVGYEERWEYDHRCAPLVTRVLDLNYRTQSFYFLNGRVAEIYVSVW